MANSEIRNPVYHRHRRVAAVSAGLSVVAGWSISALYAFERGVERLWLGIGIFGVIFGAVSLVCDGLSLAKDDKTPTDKLTRNLDVLTGIMDLSDFGVGLADWMTGGGA